ncbi:ABC transporter ATP-binding protein [Chromobacterium sp. LK1]|uniref:ABC transporter ATP-binding protein n=1 Tax=Chromobacterium sp. LK1 TaxID=1628193 RepID=UPI000652D0F6|nr:ABC transporter ATP-binding protein [Chromobacterium sp. LK1]KMN34864.1 ABC transporter ATP-binding protein [Chromobacterium sp. LK1]
MLELRQIDKRFGARVAADQLSLEVAAGETLALLGPSGCGKSTLLKIIAGLLPLDGGSVRFDGEDITGQPPERRGFALMFQDFALFPHLDVLNNVMFGLIERGVPRRKAADAATAMLERLGLTGYQRRKVWTLSGGEQQRVALARALVTQPRLLLLDEPFSSLDAHLRAQLRQEFAQLLADSGMPAILVTHDRDEAFAMAQRVAVLREGRVEQCAPPAQLLARPASAWLARFIGYQNVLERAVVPGHALLLGPEQAPARIEALTQLADGVELRARAQAGVLSLVLSAREAAALGAELRVGGRFGLGVDAAALIPLPAESSAGS